MTIWAQIFTGLLFYAFWWDKPSENTCLWQYYYHNVASAFKGSVADDFPKVNEHYQAVFCEQYSFELNARLLAGTIGLDKRFWKSGSDGVKWSGVI